MSSFLSWQRSARPLIRRSTDTQQANTWGANRTYTYRAVIISCQSNLFRGGAARPSDGYANQITWAASPTSPTLGDVYMSTGWPSTYVIVTSTISQPITSDLMKSAPVCLSCDFTQTSTDGRPQRPILPVASLFRSVYAGLFNIIALLHKGFTASLFLTFLLSSSKQ